MKVNNTRLFKIAIIAVILMVLVTAIIFILRIIRLYRPDESALSKAISQSNYIYVKTKDNFGFIPKENNGKGVIYYPGELVEPLAYSHFCSIMAEKGYTCIIVSMPLNLAVLDSNKALEIFNEYSYVERWAIAGHSLGGVMACRFLKDFDDNKYNLFAINTFVFRYDGDNPSKKSETIQLSDYYQLSLKEIRNNITFIFEINENSKIKSLNIKDYKEIDISNYQFS